MEICRSLQKTKEKRKMTKTPKSGRKEKEKEKRKKKHRKPLSYRVGIYPANPLSQLPKNKKQKKQTPVELFAVPKVLRKNKRN